MLESLVARKPKIVHGKRTTYVRGCRCELCTEANTKYGQDLKARRRRGDRIQPPLASVTRIPQQKGRELDLGDVPLEPGGAPPDEDDVESGDAPPRKRQPGRVEREVTREMTGLSAAPKHPGLVASIIAMAKILDNPEAVTTHPSAHRQLTMGLNQLWSASVGRKGKLASVAAMTARDRGDKAVNDDE